MLNKKKFYVYACDFASYRGEGILARNFVAILKKCFINYQFKVYSPIIKNKIINHSFFYNYSSPFIGIFKIWKHHLKGYKTSYVNFLPLWNSFLFLLLPKKTILGPVTGGLYHGNPKKIKTIFRSIIIFVLYRLSIFIIKKKKLNIIFATDLVKDILPKYIIKKSLFNFQLVDFTYNKNNYINKKIDILFYYRPHQTKHKNLINILNVINKNFKILVVGHNLPGFPNLGILPRKKLIKYLSNTKFIFSSPENFLSFFNLDAISCNCKIIVEKKIRNNLFFSSFIYLKKFEIHSLNKVFKDYKFTAKNNNTKRIEKKIQTINLKVKKFIKSHYGN